MTGPPERECRYQGAIVDGDRILLIEHRVVDSGRAYWVAPGGGIEPEESEEECVRREMLEETTLEVEVVRLLMTRERAEASPYRRAKTYLCRVVSGTAAPGVEPEEELQGVYEISDVTWVSLTDPESWPVEVHADVITSAWLHDVRDALGYS